MLSKGEVKEGCKRDREGWKSENVHIGEKVNLKIKYYALSLINA